MSWNRLLWAVELSSRDDKPMLLGRAWLLDATDANRLYPGEPTRALLFCNRREARDWCAGQHLKFAHYQNGHVCRYWKFRPVRVRETVKAV